MTGGDYISGWLQLHKVSLQVTFWWFVVQGRGQQILLITTELAIDRRNDVHQQGAPPRFGSRLEGFPVMMGSIHKRYFVNDVQ